MDSSFYLAVLKSKEGEFTALSKLDVFTRRHTCPLFDITPLEFDNQTGKKPKTLEEHIHNFCHKKFLKKWANNQCFIDTHLLNEQLINGVSCLEYIYSQLAQQILIPIIPVPIARVKPSTFEIGALQKIISLYQIQELGIRVTINDISTNLSNNLFSLLDGLSLKVTNSHLILDLSNSDFSYLEDFSDAIINILEVFPKFKEWKSFSICGGAFPQTNLIMKGDNYIPRNDWKCFKKVSAKLSGESYNRVINFGDYGIVSPGYFTFDPLKMSRSANIRYTINDEWYVLKGTALKTSDDYKQYVTQATKITEESFFAGQTFSKGDQQLTDCCTGKVKPGSPTVWNWAGNNHHFTKVVADLFSNPRDF
ncbi:hypothetical protein FMM05_06980 [Flavobacterium zepuense]|uniref:Beta protein n=1 Tax=Flavobacterium zepuense TaxID=2593302 RepID=A0A552V676_9FLAO|nr:hypothetical protein [Flavobacterium zepuense]TRW25959.1 hypothetical protein FMM05_06980 [Flavobacterium zepuense]